ncbi:hypothetical protein [Aeromonas caviae]|uniref:hypothetical protein n=1 Tax=Aeromonas caviae TaxID=648 RepID=UPI0029DA6F91|nr:hypothetical protein [Aeromonas caviae]MDX7784865.1 hypothetical protein [Aeromonas caviae]
MKALMSDTFMSAGSILDISSNAKKDISRVQRKLYNQGKLHATMQVAAGEAALKAIWYSNPRATDNSNLQNDWVIIGQDMQKSLDKYSVEIQLIESLQCEGNACAEHSR